MASVQPFCSTSAYTSAVINVLCVHVYGSGCCTVKKYGRKSLKGSPFPLKALYVHVLGLVAGTDLVFRAAIQVLVFCRAACFQQNSI